eukprot:311658-Chlamydomonas_euryale.AAC.1
MTEATEHDPEESDTGGPRAHRHDTRPLENLRGDLREHVLTVQCTVCTCNKALGQGCTVRPVPPPSPYVHYGG